MSGVATAVLAVAHGVFVAVAVSRSIIAAIAVAHGVVIAVAVSTTVSTVA